METVSYVFQDSRLLKTSILENVRLSRPNASRKEVEFSLHKAQCDDIIAKLPNGIDTVIGIKGVYLSGGEQQRISIARVMLKNAPIIVLDEATAFADPENEALVQKAFEELSKDKTVIMIAHRLTTVRNADRIFVLKDGKIEEYLDRIRALQEFISTQDNEITEFDETLVKHLLERVTVYNEKLVFAFKSGIPIEIVN